MGAVRPGKLAEFWTHSGYGVRVISIALGSQEWAHEQASSVAAQYVGYKEPGQLVTRAKSFLERSPIRHFLPSGISQRQQYSAGAAEESRGRPRKRTGFFEFYRQALVVPDRFRSWIRPAVQVARSWKDQWRPDVIYSSGPPNSGHIVAKVLGKYFAVPWIAEIRDAWIDNPYGEPHWLVEPFFNRQARRTLAHAAGLVVVTKADQAHISAIFPVPVVLSYNGYDPEDFRAPGAPQPFDRERLTILHAGVIYPGRRDPTPLFRAMSRLGSEARNIRCLFFGEQTDIVAAMADSCGVRACVETGGALQRSQILSLEREVDVLLECHWQNPAGDGVIPGKLFEYIGARRPILSLGSVTAEPAAIVRENGLGLASNDPEEIRKALLKHLEQKRTLGRIPDFSNSADARFTREYQFRKIDDLIRSLVPKSVL